MKLFIILLLTVLIFALISCKTNQEFTPDTFEDTMIVFGNSGGFAGHTTSYALLKNGQFFYKAPRKDSFIALSSFDKDITKQLFTNLTQLGIDEMKINDPGNLSYFMEIQEKGTTNYLKWGGTRVEAPKNLQIYFTNLMKLAKKQNEKFRDSNNPTK